MCFSLHKNFVWKKLHQQNLHTTCNFLKKITTTKSSANFLIPEPNGQGYCHLACFGQFYHSIIGFCESACFLLSVSLFNGKHEGMRENFEKQTYSEPLKTKMPDNFGQYFAIPATVYNILVLWRLETKSALLQGQPRSAVLMHSGTRSSKIDQY